MVALAIGIVVALLAASGLIVIFRDLLSGPVEPERTVATRPAETPEPTWLNSPPAEGCQPSSATPGIDGQAAGRELCRRYADALRDRTDAMFECRIGDRLEDCRAEAAAGWQTLLKLTADPDYRRAKALLDGAHDLAQLNGDRYLSPDCKGRNDPDDETATDCASSYSAFGVGLSSLEYLLRSL